LSWESALLRQIVGEDAQPEGTGWRFIAGEDAGIQTRLGQAIGSLNFEVDAPVSGTSNYLFPPCSRDGYSPCCVINSLYRLFPLFRNTRERIPAKCAFVQTMPRFRDEWKSDLSKLT
jgi:hypothetical protein